MRYYKFPEIETIDDVLPAIKDRDEFVVAERDWGTVIDYQITLPDSFPCPVREAHTAKQQYNYMVRRECRGLKFGLNGKLIARPYHKFFNLGERPETTDDELSSLGAFHKNFVIMPKLDGSMIHPITWNDTMYFCTRMGITDVANQAYEFAGNNGMYERFSYDMCQRGLTPIFEWCSRKQRIVLDYPQDSLILTAIRVNRTGEYLTRGKMQALAVPYGVPMVDLYDGSWDGIEKFSKHVRDIENAEGYVIRWDDGNMIKMKGEWYVAIHRAKDSIMHEKRIIALILNDSLDDVMPHLLPQDYDRLDRYRNDFWRTVDHVEKTLDTKVSICRSFTDATGMEENEAKGWFARQDVSQYKGVLAPWKGLLFATWDKKDKTRNLFIDYLRKRFSLDVDNSKANGSQAVVDELRDAFMLPEKKWEDY